MKTLDLVLIMYGIPSRVLPFALSALALTISSHAVAKTCTISKPVIEAIAISPYESEEKYADSTREMRSFIGSISAVADSHGADERKCAIENLAKWAQASALLRSPTNFEGHRQRIRYATALNVAAVKLGVSRQRHAEIVDWLSTLSVEVTEDFARHRELRGSADNLYVWSGVAAASFLLLEKNASLERYAKHVWEDAIVSVQPNGSVALELKRGTRSTPYHLYYLSAALWLRHFLRVDDGQPALDRLKAYISSRICGPDLDPHRLPSSISAEYVRAVDDAYWRQLRDCGVKHTDLQSPLFGGDMAATFALETR